MSIPSVSIVVPVYNLEFYIERCLDSLARQTLAGIEVIVVNDGSTDDSQLIIDEFVERYPQIIRSFEKTNGGHGSACNVGIERAAGDYIMIVDGDDYLDLDTAEYMYNKAVETGSDLLIGNLLYCYTGSTEPFKPLPFHKETELSLADRNLLFEGWATPCGRLYHKSIFQDPDVRLKEGIIFADANFVPKSYLVANKIYYVDKELYNYDITRPTQSMKQTDKRILNIVDALTDMLEFYKKKGEFERYRDRLQLYTVRHAVAWVGKIRMLEGYDKLTALQQIFAVPDAYFGPSWVKDKVIAADFGRKMALLLPFGRRFNYYPILLRWKVGPVLQKIDATIERILMLPISAYRSSKYLLWRTISKFA